MEGSDRSAPRFEMRTEGRLGGVHPRRGAIERETGGDRAHIGDGEFFEGDAGGGIEKLCHGASKAG